jgi:tetratricopeptide (TPR) repeat protein
MTVSESIRVCLFFKLKIKGEIMLYGKKKFSYLLLAVICLFFVSAPVTAQLKNQTAIVKKKTEKKSNIDFTERGIRFVKEGKYEQALADFKRALLLTPDDPVIYNNLGAAYTKQERYTQALEAFRQSIAINPEIAVTYYNMGIVYDHLNRPAEALASVRKAVEIEPKNTKAFVLMCELGLAAEQNKEAVGCYESLQTLTALDGKSMTYYGMALMRTKKSKAGNFGFRRSRASLAGQSGRLQSFGKSFIYKEAL